MNLPCLTFYDILREATCLKLVFSHSLFSEKHLSYIFYALVKMQITKWKVILCLINAQHYIWK